MILPEMKNKYFNFSSFNNSPSAKNHLNSVQPETQYHETIQQKGKKKKERKKEKKRIKVGIDHQMLDSSPLERKIEEERESAERDDRKRTRAEEKWRIWWKAHNFA